jgi:hypothetical protein
MPLWWGSKSHKLWTSTTSGQGFTTLINFSSSCTCCQLLLLLKKNDKLYFCQMWVQFTNPHLLDQCIRCILIKLCSLWSMNWFKIQWNHLSMF